MPTYFQRPENALNRANEFDGVGKKERALDVLSDVIKSKKHRTWHKIHEPIMEKFVTLCVELKKSHAAKEGLYQYKNICQQVNIKSLDHVMNLYLQLAEEKTENARKESHQQVVDSDDLDDIQTPEKLLLSAVSGEDSQDRNDRAILTPWLKFMWESFRQCLDLLRNNPYLEKLYQDVAQKALKFCLKYSRKTEFRKLCENLRTHLGHIQKNQNTQRSINLSNPESQSLHLETRLAQLECAIQMELWQEAFKAVEDIHSLIVLPKKQPKPALMATYYQKLALVLQKSGNGLFHACALHRLYHLCRDQKKNITESEVQKLASKVLCATLAIPLSSGRYQNDHIIDVDDSGLEKQKKLATLLSYNTLPSRSSLIRDVLKHNILQYVYPELIDLYNLLEVEFHPTELANKVAVCLEFLSAKEDFASYVSVLQDVTIVRFLKQISQVYQTISLPYLHSMVPFADSFHIERLIVDAVKNYGLKAKINHQHNHLSFDTHIDLSHEDPDYGTQIQCMVSTRLRNQVINMSSALQKIVAITSADKMKEERESTRNQILQHYKQMFKKEHQHMLLRRQIIEERKEELESLNVQRERQELEQLEEQKRRHHEAEMARLSREAEEREKQRKIDEHHDIQKKVARERIEQLKTTSVGFKAFADLSEEQMASMDLDDILAKQVEHLEKEKKEKEEKLKAQEKKVDYFERAKCLEEIPLLMKKYEDDKVTNRIFWEETEKERIQELINERKLATAQKERLIRMKEDQEAFMEKIKAERMSLYKEKLSAFEKTLNEERQKLLLERKEKRKEERKLAYYKEREERIQRRKDEELKRVKEEQEREVQAKKEQEEKEYKEKLRKLEEIEEKKRQREQEIEEREKKRREELAKPKEKPATTWKEEPPKVDRWRNDKDIRGPRDDRDGDRFRSDRDGDRFRSDRDTDRFRSDRDTDRFRGDRDGRGFREEKTRDDRDWRTPRNDESSRKDDNWRRDDAPKRTDAWRSQRREEPAKKEDSWRAPRSNAPVNNRIPDKKEEPRPKGPRKPEEDDGWQTVRH